MKRIGIDIGTTTVSAVVLDDAGREVPFDGDAYQEDGTDNQRERGLEILKEKLADPVSGGMARR